MPVPRSPRRWSVLAVMALAALVGGEGLARGEKNDPPAAVFKTRPKAQDGVISGRGPLDVMFNMCPTEDGDPGDQLKFTYDFDGDGVIDYYGHCRQGHTYPVSDQCVDATVCVTDRQPGHVECRTYAVCSLSKASGGGSETTPPPPPTPDILPSTYDLYKFTGTPGTTIDVSVDTVSAESAFDPNACLSTTPDGCVLLDETVIDWGDDEQECTFPPPDPTWQCPSFSTVLPEDSDGVYYLLVSDGAEDDFAGDVGLYSLKVTATPAIGPLVLQRDNASDPEFPVSHLIKKRPHATPAPTGAPVSTAPAATTKASPAPGGRPTAPVAAAPRPAGRGQADSGSRTGPVTPPSAAPAAAPTGPGAGPAVLSGDAPRSTPRPPQAVFKTRPPADAKGVVRVGSSSEVTFDLCGSTAADGLAADILKFTYDFDGDGVVDESGRCRLTHRYQLGGDGPECVAAVACVSGGDANQEACHHYSVCARRSR